MYKEKYLKYKKKYLGLKNQFGASDSDKEKQKEKFTRKKKGYKIK